MSPTIGAPAPEFTLKDQDQKEIKLSDYKGKKNVVLVFYPLDWSPVCTKEHACMVNDKKQFEDLDAQVLGLSVDSVWSHKAYADKMGIHYPLLADFQPRGAVAAKYGVYLEDKGNYGPRDLHHRSRRQAGLAEKLRHPRGAGHCGSLASPRCSEIKRGVAIKFKRQGGTASVYPCVLCGKDFDFDLRFRSFERTPYPPAFTSAAFPPL